MLEEEHRADEAGRLVPLSILITCFSCLATKFLCFLVAFLARYWHISERFLYQKRLGLVDLVHACSCCLVFRMLLMLFLFLALDSDCFPLVPYSFCQVSDDFSLLLQWILADYEEDLHLGFHGWKCLCLVSSVFFSALLLDATFFLFCIHFLFAPTASPFFSPGCSAGLQHSPREGPTRAYATASMSLQTSAQRQE